MVEYFSLKYLDLAERFTNPGLDDEPPYEAYRWANTRAVRNGISEGLRQYLDNRFQDAVFKADKSFRKDLDREIFDLFTLLREEKKQDENKRIFISDWVTFTKERPQIINTQYVAICKTFLSIINSFRDWFFNEDIDELFLYIEKSSTHVEYISKEEKDLIVPLKEICENGSEEDRRRKHVFKLLFLQLASKQPKIESLDWTHGTRTQLKDDYIKILSQSVGLSKGQGQALKKKVAEPMESQFLGETITRYWSIHLGIT